jgi:hypothetical protein
MEIKSLMRLGKLSGDNHELEMLCDGLERAVMLKFFYDQAELAALAEKDPVNSYFSY